MLAIPQVLVILLVCAGFLHPPARRSLAAILAITGLAAAGTWAVGLGDGQRSLDVTFQFCAFMGNKIGVKDFPIETVAAGDSAWLLPVAAFCVVWAGVLFWLRPRTGQPAGRTHPFWMPMLLAWSGCATMLWLEQTAAPAGVVAPAPFERVLFPVTVTAAWLFGARCRAALLALSWLSLFVTMTRIPLAIFATFATNERFGTSLDVHSVVHFANPLISQPVVVEAGTNEQLGWLIWAPQLLIFPAIYMFSTGGVAVLRVMIEKAGMAPSSPRPS